MALVSYSPRPLPTLGDSTQLYLQQELAAISNAINASNNTLNAAWTAYTPALFPDSGTLGSASATGRYLKIGKTVHIQLSINITSVGTASGFLNVTLPFNTAGQSVISGWENIMAGKMMQGNSYVANAISFNVRDYANGSPIVAGYNILLGGVYECI